MRVVVGLNDLFAGRIPPPTLKAWAWEMQPYDVRDAVQGARTLGRMGKFPALADLVESTLAARGSRVGEEERVARIGRRQLESGPLWQPAQARRDKIRWGIIHDIAAGKFKNDPRKSDWEALFFDEFEQRAAKEGL